MYYKLLLGLTLSAVIAVSASAQSGSRASSGSSSRGSSNAAANAARANANANAYEKKLAHQADREYLKAARQLAKSQFAPIHLSKQQLQTLKESVAVNFQTMAEIENSIGQYIPAKKSKALKKSYKKAIKEGKNEMEAMSISMKAVGMSEASQQKVMELSKTKMELIETVKASVLPTLTAEQKELLSASMSEEMGAEKITAKEMTDKQGSSSK